MVTLGLDASTTCVGYAFTQDEKIIDMGFIDIKKETTPKDKVQKVLEILNKHDYIDDYCPYSKVHIKLDKLGQQSEAKTQREIAELEEILPAVFVRDLDADDRAQDLEREEDVGEDCGGLEVDFLSEHLVGVHP